MNSIIDEIHARAADRCRTVVLPEGTDIRVLKAALEVKQREIASPVLLGDPAKISLLAMQHGLDLTGIRQFDPVQMSRSKKLLDYLASRRRYRKWSRKGLSKALQHPLIAACCMLGSSEVDACVAGAATDSAQVIRHVQQLIGLGAEQSLLSSFFLMVFAEPAATGLDYALFADCAINVQPDSEQLAQIALSTADSAQQLFALQPYLAMLSFSTAGSARHQAVSRVRGALERLQALSPELNVIGEIQFDAALVPDIRRTKMPGAGYEQAANVYIFPDLNSGNIAYKLAERLAAARAIGPIFQGLNKPLNDVSRGANVEAIVNTIALTCLQAG